MTNLPTSDLLKLLKEKPEESTIDHIEILHILYYRFTNKEKALQPIMDYFLGDCEIENAPTLKEKKNWDKNSFNKARQKFIETFPMLVSKINQLEQ